MKFNLLIFAFLFLIIGCATRPNPLGWTEKTIATKHLSFQVWEKGITPERPMRIYIEGEGDPTPRYPIAMELAERDNSQNIIYVSRPCQYVWCQECKNPALWQEERFNEEIIDETKNLIDYFIKKYKPSSLELVGYEGGGTVAMLIAAKRPVDKVITVGGILDTRAYAESQEIVLNGMTLGEVRAALATIPQVHYVGGKDTVTPRSRAENFVNQLYNPKSAVIKVVPSATHTDWRALTIE